MIKVVDCRCSGSERAIEHKPRVSECSRTKGEGERTLGVVVSGSEVVVDEGAVPGVLDAKEAEEDVDSAEEEEGVVEVVVCEAVVLATVVELRAEAVVVDAGVDVGTEELIEINS